MWQELKTEADVQRLMISFGSFHDSCLRELSLQTREFVDERLAMCFDNKTFVRMLFQRQMRKVSAIEIVFEDVIDFNWVQDEKNSDSAAAVIYQAVCIWDEGILYWAEDIDWSKDSEDKNDYRWIAASQGRWRILDNGLGSSPQSISTD
ncbi:hypothetical protein [Hymenobacter sp. GOD-10R]|uniref:hypothetical protein n=1 Tax=Hymenobacter sp. GOD-10R TaxID=3093922 RepID=UPI002D793CF7|nr:hypothetical protein [Hymenobacter sp. GOD-10R]WRQ31062.1 hypothetical protein SD425_12410 [Hymenobacter sp. GOD-10R]